MVDKIEENDIEIFDAVSTPLRSGINFIEASAGTGKTYTIAMLVLRAVTQRAIDIDRILIVTFTRAAAAELQSRVRARLVEARDLLQGRPGEYDEVLTRWQSDFVDDETTVKRYAARLQLAIVDIDRAGIFTIHGFCQRMLQEQALESGQLFDLELLTSVEDLRRQAAEDFWRIYLYTQPLWLCSLLLTKYDSPAKLLTDIPVTKQKHIRTEPVVEPFETLVGNVEDGVEILRLWWQHHGVELAHQLTAACETGKFKKDFAEQYADWFASCHTFLSREGDTFPKDLVRLTRDGMLEEANGSKLRGKKKLEFIDSLTLPDEQAMALVQSRRELFVGFRVIFCQYLEQSVSGQLEKNGATSFDELILRLATSLKNDHSGELKNTLQGRYELALIDEFQDTDSDQWYIFSTLFGTENHLLYLIGDPKQAIYKFRGADIHSYFQARTKADHFYSLDHNHRSHPALVDAVNSLFSHYQDPFLFLDKGLSYQPIKAAKDGSVFLADEHGDCLPSFVYCQLESCSSAKNGKWTSKEAGRVITETILHEISNLLSAETAVKHISGGAGEQVHRAIRAQDIAILVRSNKQAEQYQQALIALGVPAIIAGRKTIFQTTECRELLLLLHAVIECDNLQRLKSAMTISLFGCSGNQLVQCWQDEEQLNYWYTLFAESSRLWHESGALIMLYHLVGEEHLFANLAKLSQPERRIANFIHLFEVIQKIESDENFGPRQTLLWLRTAYEGGAKTDDVELRLESDEEAVQIVTIHSSKGLQYPVVFCPDLYMRSARLKHEKSTISCNDNGLVVDLGSPHFETRRELARGEELAEDLRLLYVALTRAELRCYCFWAEVKPSGGAVDSSFNSALAHLLFDQQEMDFESQKNVLLVLAESASTERRMIKEEIEATEAIPSQRLQRTLQQRKAPYRSLSTEWQMTSYSALASLSDHADIVPYHWAAEEESDKIKGDKTPFAVLPKGARFGNIAHDLLEELPFQKLAQSSDAALQENLLRDIEKKSVQYGVQLETDLMADLLAQVVTTPLIVGTGQGFTLAELGETTCLKEMEFYIHLALINMREINDILVAEPTVQPLSTKTIQGYLTGFIDLICVHDGKYYVIDYKSNYLGDSWADYSNDSLVEAMASHNYGLQYFIYSVVLHQHLQTFVENYSYQEHFGGVIYLFLRGMTAEIPGNGVFCDRPSEAIIEALGQLVEKGGRR